ncbi:Ig domain-containing protein [Amycolatopsis sp. H20-H5]|uniref:Ig domain-containing protein n=1 Tax=Amycolatopsis sp. H20-H5 TaxID=3046309 RepID=UPI002DBE1C92|nr:Ig domain-containing protein [Amycolatopsis sp. H20-H5]MEC3978115.1 Ig domain-containing protein [Amycolatopsis sp. H20-H5]
MNLRLPGVVAIVVFAGALLVAPAAAAPAVTPHRVLFDNSKAETAGNADWIISTAQPDPTAQNASPQKETDWTGALSAWGVALQKTGQYSLKTVPAGGTITYGNTSNPLDLANFDEFVLPEPNIVLSAAEKAAVIHFVQNGGGLFLISDHTGSDRNNDGWDSPAIINDLMSNNGVTGTDPFGFSVDLKNIVSDHPVALTDATNPVLNGAFGTVHHSLIANGTTFTLKPADNPAVKGLAYLSTATPGNTNAFFVTSTFGSGRVAVWGDSSTIDDGTGQSGNNLFNGWTDPTADNAALGLNATAWLAGSGGGSGTVSAVNPGAQSGTVGQAASVQLSATGGTAPYTWSATGLPAGLSISSAGLVSGTPSTAGSFTVTATATDAASATGSTSFAWTVGGTGGSCAGAGQKLVNPGFEAGATGWTDPSGVIAQNGPSEPARTGTWDGWLDGYGAAHTDTLSQSVTLPTGCASYSLAFWLHVDSAETGTTAYDKLVLKVGDGTTSTTLATYSNLDAAAGYQQHTFSLAAYAGKTVTLTFTGTEGSKLQTSFVLDDTALTAS